MELGSPVLQADSLPPELHRNPTRCEGACNYITRSHFFVLLLYLIFPYVSNAQYIATVYP